MLTVSDDARAHLASLLENVEGAPDDAAIRLVAQPQGLGLAVDTPDDADETVEHDGRTILVMDAEVASMLDERTLDIQQTEQGTALAIS